MASISQIVASLVTKAIGKELIQPSDNVYARNQILGILKVDTFEEEAIPLCDRSIPELLDILADDAVNREIIENLLDEKEKLQALVMNVFLSKPSQVNQLFYQKYEEAPEKATNYFYQLSKDSNYIQTKRIAKNIQFKTASDYGDLDITINLSKPEKDPEQIRRERERKLDLAYPKCLLCAENEGYVGRIGHPARSNHRIIEVPLEGEKWFLQYSPYVYYNEHCIIFAKEHRPMKINRESFLRLTAFVEKFPHYFAGSNADLPIVGGSILSHDHYQGGNYTFAMTRADDEFSFEMAKFSDVKATVIKWPMSVIRLRHKDRHQLTNAADYILQKWREYSDVEASILSHTAETPHNTITPIARMRNGLFELDLVLRNNRQTEEHPMGLFHPHEDVHHIKKENIGLIEVMGLAVLPPRLKDELEEIKKHLLDESVNIAEYHKNWVQSIKRRHSNVTAENVNQIVENELGLKFARVLEDAGVFKTTEDGRIKFKRFLSQL
ncbi:UDP-glucose--hexose-1-phosphate uridylyltransferase [Gracilibacillus xinjiangensis]|uniref:Galactose-1-phosphate uridylyltransferase n=1 Tax=Gracilibacillus xinjiangensis TaxID=1193282 RepID=A0ABV8WSC6_9BACI